MKSSRSGRLRSKIMAWSFAPTAFVLVAVALVTVYAYQQVTEELVIQRDQELIRLSASQLATELGSYVDELETLARMPDMYGEDPDAQRDALKRSSNRLSLFDGGVLILDTFGRVVGADPERPAIRGQDWSESPYYRDVLRGRVTGMSDAVYSQIVPDGPGGADVIVIAVPIVGPQEQFRGVVAGMFRIGEDVSNRFYADILKLRIGESGSYLIDARGRVIYHSDSFFIGEYFSQQPVVARAHAGEVGAIRTRDLEGQEIVAGFAPVPGTGWGLVTQEMWRTLTSGFRAYQRFLLVLLALGVAAPAILVTAQIRRITKPIGDLISAAQEVARGRFGQMIRAETGDEIEELAEQFNIMSAELAASYAHLERRVADRTRELAALNAISAVVSRSLDLDEILDDALEKTLEVMNVEAGGVYLLQREEQLLRIAAHRGFEPEMVAAIDSLELGEGFSGRVVRDGQALVVNDMSRDPRLTRSLVTQAGFRAVATFPLVSSREVLGSVFVVTRKERVFAEQDVALLTAIGQQIGVAVDNARLFGQSEAHSHELEALYRANQEMHRHLHLDQVLQTLVDVAVDILEADKSALLTWDEDLRLSMLAARGFLPETVASFSVESGECLIGQAALTAEPAFVEETLAHADVSSEMVKREDVRALMIIPIILDDQVFGVFIVGFEKPRRFRLEDQRLFTALVQRGALAIENARLYEQAQELAAVKERQRLARDLHDAVTQTLFSASLIAEVLPRIWERDPDQGHQRLQELRQLTRGALAEMRTLLLELRPTALDDALLGDLLRQLAEATTGRSRVPVEVVVEGEGTCDMPAQVKISLYRIAQETLNNIAKHAGASRARVSLFCQPHHLVLEIRDDGRGFEMERVGSDHLGLGIMRERAEGIGARLTIESAPDRGTRVVCEWSALESPQPTGRVPEIS